MIKMNITKLTFKEHANATKNEQNKSMMCLGNHHGLEKNIRRFEGFKFNASSVEYQNKLGPYTYTTCALFDFIVKVQESPFFSPPFNPESSDFGV
jgi:hypothetical protein